MSLLSEFQWQKLFKRCGLGDLHPTKQIKQTTFLNSKDHHNFSKLKKLYNFILFNLNHNSLSNKLII
jgi:hypothetical protein